MIVCVTVCVIVCVCGGGVGMLEEGMLGPNPSSEDFDPYILQELLQGFTRDGKIGFAV